ncbi:ThiF family adenylyltransferase [Pseudopedobacter beijingensis]|uniref:ThiF family adenylyltransferase n=1 Tax=Pseudopedobacter beijingensis TaxID=1207056 RepID=A0ABW4IJB5_9SPHI
MQALTKDEIARYSRQLILDGFGLEAQLKLKASKVLFIGAGGLGCPAMLYLASAGVGHIAVIDFDKVEVSNLHRQILYTPADIGRYKAEVAVEKLRLLNPLSVFEAIVDKLTIDNAKNIFAGFDLILDGSDNFTTRYLVNDICVSLGKTWVSASLFKFEGQLAVFNYKGSRIYRDLYPEAPDKNTVPNCSEIGVLGVLPGIMGTMMANEAIKIITGTGEVLSDKLLVYDALTADHKIFTFAKKERKDLDLPKKNTVVEVDIVEIEKPNHPYFLIDVREEWEFEDYNKGGVNIPLSTIPDKLDSLENVNNIICCCSYGGKSKIAAKLIKDKYPEKIVYSVKDGIEVN